MKTGVRYVVTKASDDGTFETGDHISLNADGSINCRQARGWIEECDVESSTKCMEVEIDREWIE